MRFFSVSLVSCAFLAFVVAGCDSGKANLTDLVPVSGTVTLDGQPAAGVMVAFFPTGSAPGVMYYGNTDESGRYELQDREGRKGAPVGDFRVSCSKWVMPDGSEFKSEDESPEMAGAVQAIPARYSDDAETELKATVPAGGGTIDFPLTSG